MPQNGNGGVWHTQWGNNDNRDFEMQFKEFGGNTTLHGVRYVADSTTQNGNGGVWPTNVHPAGSEVKPNGSGADEGDENDNRNFNVQFKEFGGNATLHGLRYVADSDMHILRRLLWLCIMIGLAVLLSIGLSDSFRKYRDRPIATVVTVNYVSNVTFPAVTLCNYNLFKSSLVTPAQARLVSSIFSNANEKVNVNWTEYEIQTGRPLDPGLFALRTAHRIEDMLLECRWRSVERCTAANFTLTLTDWGVCYTFNNDPLYALQEKQPGSNNGLSLRLNVEQYEYTFGENTGAGFKVLLHPQGQHPLVKDLGFSVSPGFETSVSVRYNSVTNLEHPYPSNCTDKSLLYSKKYTVPLCRYECMVDYVTKMCGCKDVRFQGDTRICSPQEQIDCIYPAEANFTASDIKCDCPVACTSIIYEGRISMAHWPAVHIATQLEQSLNVTADFARTNLLDLKIYFEELSYQDIKQVPAYDANSLQSDVGGYMGLLCGMSIITVGEFLDFFAALLFKRCKKN